MFITLFVKRFNRYGMMKRYLLYVLLAVVVLPVCGQGVTDYYRLPDQGHQYNRLVSRYGGPAIQNRWYVALDGFVKTDRAQLSNSLNGLIESDLIGKSGMGRHDGLGLSRTVGC